MSGDAPKGYVRHALVAVFVIAALFGAVSAASAAGNASDSNANITNSSATRSYSSPCRPRTIHQAARPSSRSL